MRSFVTRILTTVALTAVVNKAIQHVSAKGGLGAVVKSARKAA